MAGVCGVKILLLWSAFFYITNSENKSALVSTTAPIPVEGANTSDVAHRDVTTTLEPDVVDVHCSFTATPVEYGFLLVITSSDNSSSFKLTIAQPNKTDPVKEYTLGPGSRHIKSLKPCTDYKLKVSDNGSHGIACKFNGSDPVKTWGMTIDQIIFNVKNCSEAHCFQTLWNIVDINLKPGRNDTCNEVPRTFPTKNCNDSFTLPHYFGVGFYNRNEVHFIKSNKFPATIKAKLLEQCNFTENYSCGNDGSLSNLSNLEPFTDYNCSGYIQDNRGSFLNLTGINFRIDCALKIYDVTRKSDNTSVHLTWKINSSNCRERQKEKFSYSCNCTNTKRPRMNDTSPLQQCKVTELTPFTTYICEIQYFYGQRLSPFNVTNITVETEPAVPGNVTNITFTFTKHNEIKVTCKTSAPFFGKTELYMATLSYDSKKEHHSNKTCDFNFGNLKYLTTYELKLYTFNGKYSGHVWRRQITTLYNDKAIIGVLVFFIILILVALLFVSYKIYRLKRTESQDLNEENILIPIVNEEENLRLIDPIPAEMLLETYKLKAADEARLFLAEFQSIPRIFSRYNVKEAKKNVNGSKNRYIDILPYDYNRVQLTTGNGETGCDYINASFIDGFKELKKYIAAQGPKDETVGDFWRMVWEQKSSIIIMVTRCEEGKRPKCTQYWPSSDQDLETYEEFEVQLKSEDLCPNYIIRHLSLMNKKEKNSEREVTHIQFISWPDHGIPSEAHLLLKLRRRVNAFKNLFSGPIVVHCSAGVGRTGTYISIDAMMESLEAEGHVDIFGFVVTLRKQRCLMVQVEGQYTLIHQALLEHTLFGETEIALAELHSAVATLNQRSLDNEPTLMEEEFDRLANYKNWRTTNTGMTEENKKKNRSMTVIPYDYNRVLLKPNDGVMRDTEHDEEDDDSSMEEEEDEHLARYINASYINGYWGPRSFITTQTPMPETIADFWLMVYQNNASMVVMFSDTPEDGKESDFIYWGTDNKAYGDIEVEMTRTKSYTTFISRNALIRHIKRKESRPVKHVQFLNWKKSEIPKSTQVLMDFMNEVRSSSEGSKSLSANPIVVHCNDGSSRSGIFCALWNLLDSAETEKVVDIFQVSKALCKERQGLISSMIQYQFLYDALETFYPLQNGNVKAELESDWVQIVNETKAAEQPQSTTMDLERVKEEVMDNREPESNSPSETNPLEGAALE